MLVSLFSPICAYSQSPLEKCSAFRGFTNFFDFGQKRHIIRQFEGRLELIEKEGSKQHWIMVAFRVIACLTVIIPLIMALGVLIYRAANNFQNHSVQLPSDIFKILFHYAGSSCVQLGTTSKANYEIFKSDDALKKYRILPVLEHNLHLAIQSGQKQDVLADYALALTPLNQELALKAALKAIEYIKSSRDQEAREVSQALVLLDSEISKEAIDKLIDAAFGQVQPLLDIAKTLHERIPDKSREIFNGLLTRANSLQEDIKIFTELARIDKSLEFFEKAINSALLTGESSGRHLKDITKVITVLDPQDAVDGALKLIASRPNNIELLCAVVKALPPMDSQNAARVLKQALTSAITIDNKLERGFVLEDITKALIHVDLHLHGVLIEDIISAAVVLDNGYSKFTIFRRVAEAVIVGDSEIVFRTANLAIKYANLMTNVSYGNYPLTSIVAALTLLNPDRAFACVEVLEFEDFKLNGFLAMIDTLKTVDPEKALEIALKALSACPDCESYIKIAQSLSEANPQETCKIAKQAILLVDSISCDNDKCMALMDIANILAPIEPQKALDLVHRALDESYDDFLESRILIKFLKLLPILKENKLDLILLRARSLRRFDGKSAILFKVAESLAPLAPKMTLDLLKEILDEIDLTGCDREKGVILDETSKVLSLLNPQEITEITEDVISKAGFLDDHSKSIALKAIIKVIVHFDPEKAMALLKTTPRSRYKEGPRKALIKSLVKLDEETAMSPVFMNAKFIGSDSVLVEVATALAKTNPKKAIEVANIIKDDDYRFSAIASVAKAFLNLV